MNEQKEKLQVVVNGKSVPMNRFATTIVSNIVKGIISSLTLSEEAKHIEIKLDIE